MHDRVAAALERYQATESVIQAWVEVNPQPPLADGPLDGIPFGAKDVFETRGLSTEYGSPLYAGRRGDFDAAIVTRLRQLGATLFGKTQTAAFASFDPPPTRNPHNPAHTPGGSSSGSAAAVAAGVVPLALGTQTMGSVIRPASFCGIAGFKPTFGVLPTDGVLTFAPSLDTVGFLADGVEMCVRVWQALGFTADPGPLPGFVVPEGLPAVSAEMQRAFESTVSRLSSVESVRLPEPYEVLLQAARTINDYEGARSHYERWQQFGDRIGGKLSALIQHGIAIPEREYQNSLDLIRRTSDAMADVFARYPVLLTPAAPGAAPNGLTSTGDPAMNAVWTAFGTPAVCIPMPHDGELPLGLQLIGARHADDMLLAAAAALEEIFRQ